MSPNTNNKQRPGLLFDQRIVWWTYFQEGHILVLLLLKGAMHFKMAWVASNTKTDEMSM